MTDKAYLIAIFLRLKYRRIFFENDDFMGSTVKGQSHVVFFYAGIMGPACL